MAMSGAADLIKPLDLLFCLSRPFSAKIRKLENYIEKSNEYSLIFSFRRNREGPPKALDTLTDSGHY